MFACPAAYTFMIHKTGLPRRLCDESVTLFSREVSSRVVTTDGEIHLCRGQIKFLCFACFMLGILENLREATQK